MGYTNTRFINLIRLSLFRYLDSSVTKSNDGFTNYIKKSVGSLNITEKEALSILNHFKKEIYPLKRKTIKWMQKNLNKDEIYFNTKFKEMKKLK